MTRQVFRTLVALVALAGLFAMHGFAVGHSSGECLTATHDTAAHQATAHGAAAPAVMGHGELIVRAVDCGPLGVTGLCLAVLLASMLLALPRLAARRRWAVPDLDSALEHAAFPARPGASCRIRGPSPVQLCVLRT